MKNLERLKSGPTRKTPALYQSMQFWLHQANRPTVCRGRKNKLCVDEDCLNSGVWFEHQSVMEFFCL